MIAYEVTAVVEESLVPEYEAYMRNRHIPDVLATGCFAGASFSRGAGNRYRMRYESPDHAALERYLSVHAPRLRKHVMEQFPAGVQLSREEWTILSVWPDGGADPRPT